MKKIPLSNGGSVTVDDDDYEFMRQFKWRSKKSDGGSQVHAVRDVKLGDKKVTVRMHRLLTEADPDHIVFHVNGNGLDNRKRNLQARPIRPWTTRASTSALRGVRDIGGDEFLAEIEFTGRTYQLGVFDNPEDAAHEYDRAAREIYGPNARTNF